MTGGPEGDSERRLVARLIRRRDRRAFGILYERHTPYLYRLALRLSAGDSPSAEDAVHDAWFRAVPRLPGFAWRSSLRTWLAGFVVNAIRERSRAEPESLPSAPVLPADDLPLAATCDRVDLERALATLPVGFREILVLHDVEGYTHEEIAALRGIEPGTSKSQLSRARAAMRRALTASASSPPRHV